MKPMIPPALNPYNHYKTRCSTRYRLKTATYCSICALLLSGQLLSKSWAADPFETCPTKAFIIQTPGVNPIIYGVDLGTGSYTTLSPNMGIEASLNGVGFSYQDNYLYGWDYEHQTLGIAGNDYQITPLNVVKDSAAANAGNFFVGDVALNENVWYGYRKNKGLFKIPLDNPSSYNMTLVPSSQGNANYNITDFAFHPDNGYLYAVSNGTTGSLLKIDPANGAATNLGQVIESQSSAKFTFGAQFFDPDGNLYISNNGTGHVYRIAVDATAPSAELFSYGPSSSTNDGARCALAPVPVGDNIDFGDAPDSYGTSIEANGARHQLGSGLVLGSNADNESNAYLPPLSDDDSRPTDDEDGISLPTGFEIGEQAVLLVTVSGGSGYLNAWIDWNQNGEFDADDNILSGQSVTQGDNIIPISVPTWATPGSTWARFRLSSVEEIGPTGGVGDGEVEDYQITLTETGVSITYYPSSSGFTSIAYEDLYPEQGDFDMNDVIMHLRITEYSKDAQVRRIEFDAQLAAMGAAYHNGFAIQLAGVARDQVKESQIKWLQQGVIQTESPLETGQTNAVLVFSNDLWQQVTVADQCQYFRTEPGCGTQYRPTWHMVVPFITPVAQSAMPAFPYDPFIFATPGTERGFPAKQITGNQNPGRQLEIHLKNQAPTDLFQMAYLGSWDDASDASNGQYFQNSQGMSWAIEVPVTWKHPAEYNRLDTTYSDFIHFAADSSGNTQTDWYMRPDEQLIFKD